MITDAHAPHATRIGDILVERGAIARHTLEEHLRHMRGRMGDYLKAHNLVSPRHLSEGLGEQHGLDFVNFNDAPPDARLFKPSELAYYIEHHYVPYAKTDGRLIVATSEPCHKLQQLLACHYDMPVSMVATGAYDLSHYFASIAATTTTRRARLGLRRRHRNLTADRTLLPHQQQGILLGLMIPFVGLLLAPVTSWQLILLACNLFYFFSLYVKLQLFTHGHAGRAKQRADEPALRKGMASLRAFDLPIYSILVPMYMESTEVMRRLITNLNALDYPAEKLDIKLICEADDHATLNALKTLKPPQNMQIISVPPSRPRTKPKACNVALQLIRGEYLVIYDAEDHPLPDQLKRAVAMFQRSADNVACLQAPLNYYNRDENLLTQLFAIEYSALFRLSLPALEELKIPIPLGGTSNHLRVAALHDVGGWDAFNVTEDADLGVRLAYFGYTTRNLPSLTLEEAPITLRAWMKQRTRWVKGYIQTWLVYMRHPTELKEKLGGPAYYGFQFFIGAPALTFLLAPIFWVVFFVSIAGFFPVELYPITQILCMISLLGGVISSLLFARAAIQIEGWYHMRIAMLMYPFYWLLHSVAAGFALYELAVKPHYWAKTKHGVSRTFAAA